MIRRGVILALDIGTTGFKLGLFDREAELVEMTNCYYPINTYDGDKADSDPERWWAGFLDCHRRLKSSLKDIEVITMGVTTPGAMILNREGSPLTPAVLFMDRRSPKQSYEIRDKIGEERLLSETANLPVPGGCTASTILWWRDNLPEVYKKGHIFAHTNTFFGYRLTSKFGMDASTGSLTGLFNTTIPEKGWNLEIIEELGIPKEKLPPIVNSWEVLGTLKPEMAKKLNLKAGVPVLMGGNDVACADLSVGLSEEGKIVDIMGTCEILTTCLATPIPSPRHNIRAHVVPGRWITMFVLNTGGEAFKWFADVFCPNMSLDTFFKEFLPETLKKFLDRENKGEVLDLPRFLPYLSGDRYSVENIWASIANLHLSHNREDILVGMVKTSMELTGEHVKELSEKVKLSDEIILTGGAINPVFIEAKRHWMGKFKYVIREQSSLQGCAILGKMFLDGAF
jgi:sugar (pentulose or hexulose) kinase